MTAVTDGAGVARYEEGSTLFLPRGDDLMTTVLRYFAREPGAPILALCFTAMIAALLKSGMIG